MINILREQNRKLQQKGETIVETMIAFVICLIFLGAIAGIVTTSLSLTTRASTQANAIQESVNEVIKLGFGDGVATISFDATIDSVGLTTITIDTNEIDLVISNQSVYAFKPTMATE